MSSVLRYTCTECREKEAVQDKKRGDPFFCLNCESRLDRVIS